MITVPLTLISDQRTADTDHRTADSDCNKVDNGKLWQQDHAKLTHSVPPVTASITGCHQHSSTTVDFTLCCPLIEMCYIIQSILLALSLATLSRHRFCRGLSSICPTARPATSKCIFHVCWRRCRNVSLSATALK